MRVLKSIVLLIGALILTAPLVGQEESRTRRGHNLGYMTQELDLSDKQKAQVEEIVKTSRKNRKEDQEASKAKVETQILDILTPEQKTAFNELKAKREEKSAKRKEAQAAIKEFREKNIEPYILQKRMELESLLTSEDKAGLDKIRATKPMNIEEGRRNRSGKNNKGDRMSKENRESLKVINEKYSDDINRLQKEIQSKQESWNTEIRAILDTYKLEGDDDIREEGDRGSKKHSRKVKESKRNDSKNKRGEKGSKSNVRFLLMDVEK